MPGEDDKGSASPPSPSADDGYGISSTGISSKLRVTEGTGSFGSGANSSCAASTSTSGTVDLDPGSSRKISSSNDAGSGGSFGTSSSDSSNNSADDFTDSSDDTAAPSPLTEATSTTNRGDGDGKRDLLDGPVLQKSSTAISVSLIEVSMQQAPGKEGLAAGPAPSEPPVATSSRLPDVATEQAPSEEEGLADRPSSQELRATASLSLVDVILEWAHEEEDLSDRRSPQQPQATISSPVVDVMVEQAPKRVGVNGGIQEPLGKTSLPLADDAMEQAPKKKDLVEEPVPILSRLGNVATGITVLATVLPFTYSLAVHFFLSFFHERSLWRGEHWQPVGARITVGGGMWGTQRSWRAYARAAELLSSERGLCYDAAVKVALAVTAVLAASKLLRQTRRIEVDGPAPPLPDSGQNGSAISLAGKVVLITGANDGLGLATARELYRRGANVVLACRSRERALGAMRDIDPRAAPSSVSFAEGCSDEDDEAPDRAALLPTIAAARLHFLHVDLTSLSSVRAAVHAFRAMRLPLHVLINNAGVMRRTREVTEDGLEVTMAANHLGHFLLTNLLLAKLRDTALQCKCPSRVITISSSLYCNATRVRDRITEPGIDLRDLQCQKKPYKLFEQYAQSKLANILFALELGRRERSRPSAALSAKLIEKKEKRKPRVNPVKTDSDSGFKNKVPMHQNATRPAVRQELTPTPREEDQVGDKKDKEKDFALASPASLSKPKNSRRKRLTPVSISTLSGDEEELGLGFHDIAVGRLHLPLAENKRHEGIGTSFPKISKKVHRKRLTPISPTNIENKSHHIEDKPKKFRGKRLTPVSTSVSSEDEEELGLGFHDIAVDRLRLPLAESERDEGTSSPKINKKVRRKRLAPISPATIENKSNLIDDGEVSGLGSHNIAFSTREERVDDHSSGSEKQSASASMEESPKTNKKMRRKRLKPIKPVDIVKEEDEMGLGFNEIVSVPSQISDKGEGGGKGFGFDEIVVPSQVSKSHTAENSNKGGRQRLSPLEAANQEADEMELTHTVSNEKKKEKTTLIPDRNRDETGLKCKSILPLPAHPKPKVVPSLTKKEGEEESCKHQNEDNSDKGWIATSKGTAKIEGELFYPVQSFCLHPGIVRTNVVRDMPWYLYYPNHIFSLAVQALQKNKTTGAYCSVFCAVMRTDMNQVDSSGNEDCYFVNSKLQPLEQLALNEDDATQLWELSCKLVCLGTIEQ